MRLPWGVMAVLRERAQSVLRHLRIISSEAAFWAVGLVAVAGTDPEAGGMVNLCLIEQMGIFCPGDGLGKAIAHLARGHLASSWAAHPLAGPVVFVLLSHIATLCRKDRRGVSKIAGGYSGISPAVSPFS